MKTALFATASARFPDSHTQEHYSPQRKDSHIMSIITNPKEVLHPYIGHYLDTNQRYQLNGVHPEGKNIALYIHDRLAQTELDAQIAWLATGIDVMFDFIERVGFSDEGYNFTNPLSGKLA